MPDMDSLLVDVDLLCLDAGNTIIFLDHARLAALCDREGFAVTRDALVVAEGAAKCAHEESALLEFSWSGAHNRARYSWGSTVGTMLFLAGLERVRVPVLLETLWGEHTHRNLWSLVPDGLAGAVAELRTTGVPVAVVSNSEGQLAQLFNDLGLRGAFDLVIDSGVVGIEKPDPRIFQIALDHFGVDSSRALHLGDNFATDVLGARAVGIRTALIDPYGHLSGRHPDVPRVPGAPEVARAIASWRRRRRAVS